MKIKDMLDKIAKGQQFDIGLHVKISDVDVQALKLLRVLYDVLPDNASFADAELILIEAIFWHTTFNILETNYSEKASNPDTAGHLTLAAPDQPCGHPRSAIISTDEGTHYCGECVKSVGG